MGFGEAKKFPKGKRKSNFYEKTLKDAKEQQRKDETLEKVVKAEEMPWDDSPMGLSQALDSHIVEYAPGGRSGCHGHTNEALFQ